MNITVILAKGTQYSLYLFRYSAQYPTLLYQVLPDPRSEYTHSNWLQILDMILAIFKIYGYLADAAKNATDCLFINYAERTFHWGLTQPHLGSFVGSASAGPHSWSPKLFSINFYLPFPCISQCGCDATVRYHRSKKHLEYLQSKVTGIRWKPTQRCLTFSLENHPPWASKVKFCYCFRRAIVGSTVASAEYLES